MDINSFYENVKKFVKKEKRLDIVKHQQYVEVFANQELYPYIKASLRFELENDKIRISSTSRDIIYRNEWTYMYRKGWNLFLYHDSKVIPIIYRNYYKFDILVNASEEDIARLLKMFVLDIRAVNTKYYASKEVEKIVEEYCADLDTYDDLEYSDKQRDLGKFNIKAEHFGRGMTVRTLIDLQ